MASRGDTDELMRRALAAAGFDFARPDPSLAWRVFGALSAWAIADLGLWTTRVEASVHHQADADDDLYLRFARAVQTSERYPTGWYVGCLFVRAVPADMRGTEATFAWWEADADFASWCAEVEASPDFRRSLALDGWRWVGFGG